MLEIGNYNNLKIERKTSSGLILDGGEFGEILLPKSQCPEKFSVGELLEVFIYNDSEDSLIATRTNPLAVVGDIAKLYVVGVNSFGAFMDWGLPKDLLCPKSEQKTSMELDRAYIVKLYLDPRTNRIVASTKIDKFLDLVPHEFRLNQEVDLLITHKTDLGYKAIINNTHWGFIFDTDVFQDLRFGQKIKGFIKKIREDDKIDLSLNRFGYEKVLDKTDKILEILRDNDGFIPINDKSEPEIIYETFGESKKIFKKAIGALYKQKLILIEENGIRLITL